LKKCAVCGKELLEFESFKCDFCKAVFCKNHRLAENHNCPKMPQRSPLGNWKAKPDFNDYVTQTTMLGITKISNKKKKESLKDRLKKFFT
jgi:hypothetical protein